jgi:hypothetical protein
MRTFYYLLYLPGHNDDDGLLAYSYDGTSFTNTAHINEVGWAK